MKLSSVFMGALAVVAASSALAAQDCEQLKQQIDDKLKAKGVSQYSLEIVDKGSADTAPAHAGKVVGTCGGDTKEIVYRK